ncbi:MAG: hypothetical protein QMC51_01165 [Alteromonadaceae bacterium]
MARISADLECELLKEFAGRLQSSKKSKQEIELLSFFLEGTIYIINKNISGEIIK